MIATALVLILLDQTQPPRDTRGAATAATGSITGVVVTDDRQPRPLRRARVTLGGPAVEMPLAAITGDNGAFVFDGLPPGRYTVTASKEAYVARSYGATRPGRPGTGAQVAAGQSVAVTVRLPRGAVITGTVLDVDGHPAVGVSVSALQPRIGGGFTERQYAPPPGVIPAVTDDRGVYRIYGLPAGDYFVSSTPILRAAGGRGGAFEVRMMLRGDAVSRPLTMSPVLHPGVSDIGRATRVTVRAGEERGGIDVQLEYVPLAAVSGMVSSPIGWAPARLTLWRTDETVQPPAGAVASADDQGRFEFRGVRPGNYRVAARVTQLAGLGGRGGAGATGDVQYGSADISVNGEDIDGVALSLQPGLSIAGQVVFESSERTSPALPPQLRLPAPLVLAGASGGWPMPGVTVDGNRFRIDGIVPGAYRLPSLPQGIRTPIGPWWVKSIAAGGRELLDEPLNLQRSVDDAIVTITDRASEIGGTLRDAQGAVAPPVWVVAFPIDRTAWFFNSRRIAAVRPGRDGQWSIRNLPPGEYRVIAADLDQNEWFDPAVLAQLLSTGTAVRIAGPEKYSVDLVMR